MDYMYRHLPLQVQLNKPFLEHSRELAEWLPLYSSKDSRIEESHFFRLLIVDFIKAGAVVNRILPKSITNNNAMGIRPIHG